MHLPNEQILIEETDALLYERYAVSIFAYLRLHTASPEDAANFTSMQHAWALVQGPVNEQLYRTTDSGQTWTIVPAVFPSFVDR